MFVATTCHCGQMTIARPWLIMWHYVAFFMISLLPLLQLLLPSLMVLLLLSSSLLLFFAGCHHYVAVAAWYVVNFVLLFFCHNWYVAHTYVCMCVAMFAWGIIVCCKFKKKGNMPFKHAKVCTMSGPNDKNVTHTQQKSLSSQRVVRQPGQQQQ